MPKTPILDREVFYDQLSDGSLRDLDFCIVNTELGACVEPRPMALQSASEVATQVDVKDISFNRRTRMDEDQLYSLLGTGGRQIPIDF